MMQRGYDLFGGAALPAKSNACNAGSPMGGIDRGGARAPISLDTDVELDH